MNVLIGWPTGGRWLMAFSDFWRSRCLARSGWLRTRGWTWRLMTWAFAAGQSLYIWSDRPDAGCRPCCSRLLADWRDHPEWRRAEGWAA